MLEKSESIALEGLCPVRSSKAARLKRIKPGFYNPPGGPPVFVPGLQWLTVMVAGMQGPPSLAAMRWWTSRGKLASQRREQTASLLSQCAKRWQQRVVHIFDRGFAGAPWLRELRGYQLRFISPGCGLPSVPCDSPIPLPSQPATKIRDDSWKDEPQPRRSWTSNRWPGIVVNLTNTTPLWCYPGNK